MPESQYNQSSAMAPSAPYVNILQRHRLAIYAGLLAIAVCAVFVRLGLWQLDRARFKHELHNHYSMSAALPAVSLSEILGQPPQQLFWRRVRVTGAYLEQSDILLDNQSHAGSPGYLVYTPIRLQGRPDSVVLVNRGWIPLTPARNSVDLPIITDSPVTIAAQIGKPPSAGIRLNEIDAIETLPDGTRRVQHIDYTMLGAVLGVPLQSFVLLLDPAATDGFVRAWPIPGSDENRHRAYAVQWFAMATALAAICVILLKRARR